MSKHELENSDNQIIRLRKIMFRLSATWSRELLWQ
jgi:hypothetical protein